MTILLLEEEKILSSESPLPFSWFFQNSPQPRDRVLDGRRLSGAAAPSFNSDQQVDGAPDGGFLLFSPFPGGNPETKKGIFRGGGSLCNGNLPAGQDRVRQQRDDLLPCNKGFPFHILLRDHNRHGGYVSLYLWHPSVYCKEDKMGDKKR